MNTSVKDFKSCYRWNSCLREIETDRKRMADVKYIFFFTSRRDYHDRYYFRVRKEGNGCAHDRKSTGIYPAGIIRPEFIVETR